LSACAVILPSCIAQTPIPKINREQSPQDLFTNKTSHTNQDDDYFFNYAIIWGPFEVRWESSFFSKVVVMNRYPWNNHTMTVIGYITAEHRWVVKKSYWIECNFLHMGFVGRHWLFVIGIGNVAAF